MPRHLIGGAVAVLLAATALTGCAGRPATLSAAPVAATSSLSAAAKVTATGAAKDSRTTQQRAEDTFVAITAKHLCTVASTVYTDPKALAEAYAAVPPYPGLTAQQVAQFRKRMAGDKAFAARITAELRKTCKPGARK